MALATASLVWLQSHAGREEERASTQAARLAVDLFVTIAASQSRHALETSAKRRARAAAIEADTWRLFAGTSMSGRIARPLVLELDKAADRLGDLASELRLDDRDAARIESDTGLDSHTFAALRTEVLSGLVPQLTAQNLAVARAEKYGARQQRATFALGLTGFAGALLAMAGITRWRRTAWTSLVTGGVVLLLGVLVGASTLSI